MTYFARQRTFDGRWSPILSTTDPSQHKARSSASEGLKNAEEDAIADSLPEEATEEQYASAYADRIEEKALGYKTRASLDAYMKSEQVQTWMDRIGRADDDLRKGVREKVLAHREGLTK